MIIQAAVSGMNYNDQALIRLSCSQVVREGHSVLVFCSSRRGCETSAIHIAKYLPSLFSPLKNGNTSLKDGCAAIEELRKSSSGLDPFLAQTLPSGVAYHHAGLTVWFMSSS